MKKAMKTLVALVCAALTLGLTGCSKDADDLIIGSWNVDNMVYSTTVEGLTGDYESYNGTQSETVNLAEQGQTAIFTFNKDNTFTETMTDNDGTETLSGTYSVKDNKLTMTIDGETQTLDIENIDKKNMTISISDTETFTAEESGIDQAYSVSFKIALNFTKK